jgi:2-furoate---CoA ligase
MNLQQLFTWAVARRPTHTAIRTAGEAGRTYAELETRVAAVAAGLTEAADGSVGRVAVFSPNRPAVVVALLASIYAGGTAVPVNARADTGELEYYLADADADVLLFHESLADTVAPAVADRDVRAYQFGGTPPAWADPFESLAEAAPLPEPVAVADDDHATIVYTSGTTGEPKGVPVDHESWVYRALVMNLREAVVRDDTVGLVLPLYHVIGIDTVLASIQTGATVVFPTGSDPPAILDAVETEGITTMQGVPTLMKALADAAAERDADTSSFRRIESAGGILTDAVFEAAREHLCSEYRNFYGTTEAMHISYAREDVNSVGQPADFQEVRLVEPESNDPTATVSQGDTGEVIVRMDGPEMFDGYLNKPDATAAAVHDGWYFTEDVGYRDEAGRLWLEGRLDDLIISGGENISPSDVENTLLSHPAVREAAVVGRPDDEWGERVVAFVHVRNDSEITSDDLDAHCLSSPDLADYKRPREYVFLDEIPKNPTGKIDRAQLESLADDE